MGRVEAQSTTTATDTAARSEAGMKMYGNYDFVPGEKILFEHNLKDDRTGGFPAHRGIAEERLTAKGYGMTKPISDNTTDGGKANNGGSGL